MVNYKRLLVCAALCAMALTSCNKEDNPYVPEEPVTVEVDNPQEEVTDQPALSR